MTEEFRTNDRQLTAGDIGVLENAGQVVHFFAQLGYDVDASLPLDRHTLRTSPGPPAVSSNLRYARLSDGS